MGQFEGRDDAEPFCSQRLRANLPAAPIPLCVARRSMAARSEQFPHFRSFPATRVRGRAPIAGLSLGLTGTIPRFGSFL